MLYLILSFLIIRSLKLCTYDPPKSTTNNLCSNSYVKRVTPNCGDDLNTRAGKKINNLEYIILNKIICA